MNAVDLVEDAGFEAVEAANYTRTGRASARKPFRHRHYLFERHPAMPPGSTAWALVAIVRTIDGP